MVNYGNIKKGGEIMGYTKGKWEEITDNDNYSIVNNNGLLVADINTTLLKKEWEANANLIASAPELLSTLKQGEDIVSGIEAKADNLGIDLSEIRQWWLNAQQAIQKAEGSVK